MEISHTTVDTVNTTIPKISTLATQHYWCSENESWNHWPASERQTITNYVRSLQNKIKFQLLKENKPLYMFMQQLRLKYSNYITNHYIYSLYYVDAMQIIPLRVLSNQFGNNLYFEEGFELLVVIQPQWNENEACIVYVQECAVVCSGCITLIQLHKHQSKQAVVVCVGLPCFVLILRRLPVKVVQL